MGQEVLVASRLYPPTLATLEQRFTCHHLWQAEDRTALLTSLAGRVRAIAVSGGVGADAAVMDALPGLEVIACFGVGVDAVDLAAAAARGIRVTNTPDVLSDEVADLTIGLMLATVRQIVTADRFVRAGRWLQGPLPLNRCLTGKTLGILGLGRIGREIAARAAAMKMQIAYHSRRPVADVPYRYLASPVALADVADVLVVITPGGSETRHIVDERVLAALGPEGTLINVARGSCVDQTALVRALVERRIAGAGLDVFEDEPQVPEALLSLDTVVLQPHQASGTVETRTAMGQLMVDNLIAWAEGRPLLTPVV
ncbi:MAG: 2-hydroxyacid dehydrogenase [Alphaproteobacteria bacterium]|nr:2-hydroxyacid dehydrogenase [Alphaproteobacteria bacterium]TAD89421.1 MAG: 2-hydroxyacid dehydrogenase [Alphaproteobacteria bacterium]